MSDALSPRVAASFTRDPIYGCWLWTSKLDRDGYGKHWDAAGPHLAHRLVYEALVGPVPAGKVLDHWCRRRNCVRPEHLEPVTHRENDLRRSFAYMLRKRTCPRGHSMALPITTVTRGLLCRTCMGPERDVAAPSNSPSSRVGRMPTMEDTNDA